MNERAPETALIVTQTDERVLLDHAPELWRDERDRWVRWECRCGESLVYPDGFEDQAPLQRDATRHVLGALREAGWVDPEEAARLRQDHETDMATMRLLVDKTAEFVETRKRWEAEERLLTADRDSWKGLANATLRRQEDAEAQRAEALNLLKAARNEDDYDPAPIITEYDRIVGERDELAAAVSTLASENDRLGDLLAEARATKDMHKERAQQAIADRDALLPVVEAAKAWRTAWRELPAGHPRIATALVTLAAAVDLWESLRLAAPGETPATVEPDDARPQPVDLGQTP